SAQANPRARATQDTTVSQAGGTSTPRRHGCRAPTVLPRRASGHAAAGTARHPPPPGRSVPVVGAGVRPGAARGAVGALDVDQPGVDLSVTVRGLADAGARPGGVEEL